MSEHKTGFTHDSIKNASVDWYTPPWIFERLGLEFDLDPCAPPGGVSWIPAANHYSIQDDGLSKHWDGFVWLNPPYGKHTPDWLARMHRHRNGVALVFSRTDCRWFHDYVAHADAILFMKGRVQFVDGLGVTNGGGPGSGSMLVGWGEKAVFALSGLQDIGMLVLPNSRNYEFKPTNLDLFS